MHPKQFVADVELPDRPCVATVRPAEMIDEYGHSLYSARMFYHKRLVGDEYQAAYHAARESEEYEVSFEADYDTGDLTITVEAVP